MIIAARQCLGKRRQRRALPGSAAISGWPDPLRTAFSGQANNAAITPAPEVVADVVNRRSVGMTMLRLMFGDHLTRSVSALSDINIATDVVLMVEAAEETRYVRHHRQKIAFILSAMRHFANDLGKDGVNVDYKRLQHNPRVAMAYRQLKAMPRGRTRQLLHDARRFAGSLRQAQRQASNRQCGDPSCI